MGKEKIQQETKALVNNSIDIDSHIRQYKNDLLSNQLRDQKYSMENKFRDDLAHFQEGLDKKKGQYRQD